MQANEKVKFVFGKKKKTMEGVVKKIFDKTVYLEVDFPRHKGKTVIKKKHDLK